MINHVLKVNQLIDSELDVVYQSNNSHSLAKKMSLQATLDYPSQPIFALIPIKESHCTQTLVVYENHLELVALTGLAIIKALHVRLVMYPIRLFQKALRHCFDKKLYKIPMCTPKFCLMPLAGKRDPNGIWVNPVAIQTIYDTEFQTEIHLTNQLLLAATTKKKSLKTQIKHSLLCLAIIRLLFGIEPEPPDKNLSLQKLLNIQLTEDSILLAILKDLYVKDLPCSREEFYALFKKFERLEYQWLDLECEGESFD